MRSPKAVARSDARAIAEERVRVAATMYIACTRARGPVDREIAAGFRANRQLDDDDRAFVAETVGGMLRARRWIDAAAAHLPFEPTREALVCLWLIGRRHAAPVSLPVPRAGVEALAAAARAVENAPLPIATSLPDWLVERFLAERGVDAGTRLCWALGAQPPMTLRTNTLKTDRDVLLAALAAEGIAARATKSSPVGVVLDRGANVFRTNAFHDGLFEMQDEGSQLVGLLCEAQPGQTVVDGCAGAGGKTLLLAAQMQNTGSLYAFDLAEHRLDALKDRARRAGAHNVRVKSLHDDATWQLQRLAGKADVVLVDAPCSGTGVLRRNPDTSWKLAPDDVARMMVQQHDILDRYAALVRPGGRLVYATCSLLNDENDAQVTRFLAAHPEFVVTPARDILARSGASPVGVRDALRMAPHTDDTDGFYAMALERRP